MKICDKIKQPHVRRLCRFFITHHTLHCGGGTDDYTTKKTTFFKQFGLFSQLFYGILYRNHVENDYAYFTDRIIRYFLYK